MTDWRVEAEASERVALGTVLNNPAEAMVMLANLEADDFYCYYFHREIFLAIEACVKNGIPIDVISVSEQLRTFTRNPTFRSDLMVLVQDCLLSGNAEYHCNKVKDNRIRRELLTCCERIQHLTSDHSGEDALTGAQMLIAGVGAHSRLQSNTITTDKVLDELMPMIEARKLNPCNITGVPTGFRDLDDTLRGYQPSDLIILAARPSMGKTAFMLNSMQSIALDQQRPVLVYSLEMSKEQLTLRMLSAMAEVSANAITTGNISNRHYDIVCEAAQRLRKAPIFIHDVSALSPHTARAVTQKVWLNTNETLSMVFVDYLQLMSTGSKDADMNRTADVGAVSRGLKSMAREFNIPVMALSQLSRAVESRQDKRPMLSDLRDSGSIEQDADVVGFLYRDDYYNKESLQPGICELNIAKQRNGPLGCVEMRFRNQITKFSDLPRFNTNE